MPKEMLGGCCVCSDDRGWPENPLVYCDGQGCNVAVHQACYGIVTVPSGPWFCRKCELHERPRCDLCPNKEGAFKKTDSDSWAHVVCALYIPEVRFGNVTTMEPILISLIPQERFNRNCYICEESKVRSSKANSGACMQCNKSGCRATFHVTCAQMMGLLCEEAGNMMDNVKYCGYCQHHYAKLKATRHVKIIPPYRPVPASSSRSVSPTGSPDKLALQGENNKTSGGGNSGSGGEGSSKSCSSSATSLSAGPGQGSTLQNSCSEGGKPNNNNNISLDINSSYSSKMNSNKNVGKKSGGGYHGMGGNKSLSNAMLDNISGSGSSASLLMDDKSDGKTKTLGQPKDSTASDSDQQPRCEDSMTVKLERSDEKTIPKTGFNQKKDFSKIQLKEVVAAALDRPMSNSPGSKYDHSSSLTSGLDGPSSSLTTHSGSRHPLGHPIKLAPPDIKPDVTLTRLPMKSNSSSRHGPGKEEEKNVADNASLSKTLGANAGFHSPFGATPKLQTQVSPEILDSASKTNKLLELSQEDIPGLDKSSGPPSKRARGMSRDDEKEREQRRTPTKGRGGRRGSTACSFSRRGDMTSAVAFVDDSSFDEIIEANGTAISSSENTARSSRQIVGKKNGTIPVTTRSSSNNSIANTTITTSNATVGKPMVDPPTPTLSQLAKSGKLGGDNPPAGLAPHMFGNALNTSSSMAMKMVDTLSEEMEAVVAAGGVAEVTPVHTPLVGISLPGISKPSVASPVISSTTGSTNNNSVGIQPPPQTLEQLLERQWEQGSQFLMEQAQHLDIAQLLSCLNQLKQDNKALEEHVQSLIQRRDQLTAINARLSIPLGNSSALTSLGGAFSTGGTNSNHSNGFIANQSAHSPNVHHSTSHGSQGSKNPPVKSSAPSPQQQQDHVGQQARERGNFSIPDIAGGRAELMVTHSSHGSGPHSVHPNHGPSHGGNHRSQMMNSTYGPFVSIPANIHARQQHHQQSRDQR